MQRNPIVSIPATAQKIGISAPTVAKSLEHMRRLGILREINRTGRHRLFVYEPYLAILNEANVSRFDEYTILCSRSWRTRLDPGRPNGSSNEWDPTGTGGRSVQVIGFPRSSATKKPGFSRNRRESNRRSRPF